MNNRQNGRRRGRNNQRPQGGQSRGNGDSGNRIDNRARGNAAQLLEKYRNMARDAQLSGDRVMTEYYLQFADHYFRVLSDARSRQEEQRARYEDRDDDRGDQPRAADGEDEDGGDDELDAIDSIGRAPRNRAGRDGGNRDGGNRENTSRDGGNRDNGRDRDAPRERDGNREPRDGRDGNRRDRPERRPDRASEDQRDNREPRG
ncbi:MAG: DUF4167 domain-containing protein, partial [Sphingopyxis sp.]